VNGIPEAVFSRLKSGGNHAALFDATPN